MTPELLNYLCDPATKEPLMLVNEDIAPDGMIICGQLITKSGFTYPIIDGIPRFVTATNDPDSVTSFGEEWNYFDFADFKENWLKHTVGSTFGSPEVFRGKVVVDAGCGSGSQTLWMLQLGARHVIALEMSQSVDGVVKKKLADSGFRNFDIVQCSIDQPPIAKRSIDGMVICHNVIQHTRSVEDTAEALFELVALGGEFVFNCYPLNDNGLLRWLRHNLVYRPMRWWLPRRSFRFRLRYAQVMGFLRFVPLVGLLLEKSSFCVRGDVPRPSGEPWMQYVARVYKATVLNTFDAYGAHKYQHLKRDSEIEGITSKLQPDPSKIHNQAAYFRRPPPIGCALRIFR